MNIIIVGCGRVGSSLAILLSDGGHNVYVIDRREEAFRELGRGFNGSVIKGVGTDSDVLRAANVESCDALAAVTDNDNGNLMIASVAREIFGVPHVITRLFSAKRENTYLKLNIDYSCGTTLVAEEMYAKILAGHGLHVDTFGDFEVMTFPLSLKKEQYVSCSNLEKDFGARVIAVERGEESFMPKKESRLRDGDVIMVCIDNERLSEFYERMKNKYANRN